MDSNNNIIPIRKKWGQNFLIDQNTIQKIIQIINPNINDIILEIGPGKGAMTTPLSSRVSSIDAIEIDPMLSEYLEQKKIRNVKIKNLDILKYKNTQSNRYSKIIGNIPYNISSQIIIKFINEDFGQTMIFMLQKELAERIVSKHGTKNYGRISVMVQSFSNASIMCNISKNVFFPKPNVDSCIIKIVKKDNNLDLTKFSKFIREAFKQRRKKLKNNLRTICNAQLLDKWGDLRPEEISINNFKKIYEKIYI